MATVTCVSRPQPLASALQGRPKRRTAHRLLVSRSRLTQRCSAAGEQEGEAGTSGRDAAASQLPPLKQMPYRAIAALAAVGLADTAYLTATKLLEVAPACPLSGGCADILSSEYATLFGFVPLSAVGMLAYGGMAALAWQGWRRTRSGGADATAAAAATAAAPAGDLADSPFRSAVLAGGLALASTSSYLVYLLLTKFPGELCPYCLASAALSFTIAGLACSGLRRRELQDAAGPGAGVVATTLLLLFIGLGNPDGSFAGGYDLDYSLPAVTSQSTPEAVGLAQRLAEGGARMYGAFWCSHCNDQKQAFGQQAMTYFPYVECYPEGLHKDTKMAEACQTAPGGLTGFPTWIIGGEQLVGEQSFDKLEQALVRSQISAAQAAAGGNGDGGDAAAAALADGAMG